jgi:hypothetical protein
MAKAAKPKKIAASQPVPAPTAGAPAPGVEAEVGNEFMLFVDCIPNVPFVTLDQYISQIVSELQVSQNVSDLRFPPSADHILSFGRWKGALASVVRAAPPGKGVFVAFTRGSEFAEVVVEALVPMCAPGALVRGR